MPEYDDEALHRRLYAAVIIQALIDATASVTKKRDILVRDQARAWFNASVGVTAQDFNAVCAAADIDADRVRTFVRTYEGPPLTLHKLSQLRDTVGGT